MPKGLFIMKEIKQKSDDENGQDNTDQNLFKGKFDKKILPRGTTEWKHDPSGEELEISEK